jgi:prepilin-type processing-associated H-X9-DG protein
MEILLVITIIAVMIGFSLPVFGNFAARGRAATCVSNLRGLGSAVNSYSLDNGGYLPTGRQQGDRTVMWTELLWNYAYASKYVGYSGAELPKSLSASIFECPEARYDRRRHSSLANIRSYGMNHNIGDCDEMTAELRVSVENPQTVCLLADVKNESQLRPYTLNPRHQDQFNVLYVDNHVESLELTPEVTELKIHPFWGVAKP